MNKAAKLAREHLPGYEQNVRPLRDALEEGIPTSTPNTELNGHKTQRLVNTANITFHGIESEALLILLDQERICASSGSACLADSDEPSHVVKAMKPTSAASRQMIRFSLDSIARGQSLTASYMGQNTEFIPTRRDKVNPAKTERRKELAQVTPAAIPVQPRPPFSAPELRWLRLAEAGGRFDPPSVVAPGDVPARNPLPPGA